MNCKWLFLIIVIYFFVFSNCIEGNKNIPHLNVYGETLKECRSYGSVDKKGSWNDGFCSEMDGGVHQICLDVDKTKDFSKNTGQGPWSDGRRGKNHCMCLGAWALYKAKQEKGLIHTTDNELHCESIMDDALHERYISNWNTWNGHELPDQIVHGVNHLMDQCYEKGNITQKKHIKGLYKKLTRNRTEFHGTDTYQKHN